MSQQNNKIAIEGWTIITECLGGDELSWAVEEREGEWMPEIYEEEIQAWKAIAQHQIDIMQQFIDEENADHETVDWAPSVYVAWIQIWEDGELVVSDEQGNPIVETDLKTWRDNR